MKLSILSKYKKVIDQLQWKYFIGEFKPKQQEKMERQFKTLTSTDQATAREMAVLLDNIAQDKDLRVELGIDPYNLYPIGLSSFVNFKDLSSLVSYKVHDLSQSGQLFGDVLEKGKKAYTADDIKALLPDELSENKNYLKNFDKGYILIRMPQSMNDKTIDMNAIIKPLEFKSIRFDKPTNTFVIQAN